MVEGLGFKVEGLEGLRYYHPIMENEMEETIENEMETGGI